jgi:PAS domain-containing protein
MGARHTDQVFEKLQELLSATQNIESSSRGFLLTGDGLRDYAILLLDLQGQILSRNAGAEKVKGYSAEASPCGTYLGYLRRAEGSRGVDLLRAR